MAVSPCMLSGSSRLWQLRKCYTQMKFLARAWTRGLQWCHVISCREANGHGSSGGPSNDRAGQLWFPPPGCQPRAVISGQCRREEAEPGSPAWLHLGCKTPGGWSDRAVTLPCLLSWMRNSALRKPLPAKGQLRAHRGLGRRSVCTAGQPNSLPVWFWCGQRTQQQPGLGSTGQGGAVTAELRISSSSEWLKAGLSWARVFSMNSAWMLFPPCLDRAALLVKRQMLLPVIHLNKDALILGTWDEVL